MSKSVGPERQPKLTENGHIDWAHGYFIIPRAAGRSGAYQVKRADTSDQSRLDVIGPRYASGSTTTVNQCHEPEIREL
jgi:hypothetical protein